MPTPSPSTRTRPHRHTPLPARAAALLLLLTAPAWSPPAAAATAPVAVAAADGRVEPADDRARRSAGIPAEARAAASVADVALPVVIGGAVGVLAGYGYVRRTRRSRTRTLRTGAESAAAPAASAPPEPAVQGGGALTRLRARTGRGDVPVLELEARAGAALVAADDCVHTSREELGFAEARFGAAAVQGFARAVRGAETEVAAVFALLHDAGAPPAEGTPPGPGRIAVLHDVLDRCRAVGRRLDAEAEEFDRLRALEDGTGVPEALTVAEQRFRALTGRVGASEANLAAIGARYAPSAVMTVSGQVELAKERLVFATSRLNRSRQTGDLGDPVAAALHLRAAEGAISQVAALVNGVDRLSAELAEADEAIPQAFEAAFARVGKEPLAALRAEVDKGACDPLDVLRRVVRTATTAVPLPEAEPPGEDDALFPAAVLVARCSAAAAEDYVGAHRGAVGVRARVRLAEAHRLLGRAVQERAPEDARDADGLARQARRLAEEDVRAYRDAYGPRGGGVGGAVLGGVLLGGGADGGPPGSFGGPATRGRRGSTTAPRETDPGGITP
ncbi:hypothetical protein [Streptomyces fragilis]|uniref:hypothetical protein n=1 Tax=Streptomyces fragilis TaxID=67301 RepID=UPI0024DE8A4C|nr:hypothetical protein [Streptomyces fragilis]